MQSSFDYILHGTGLAPLASAFQLLSKGYSVALLNPEADYFLEKSGLPFDPLWPIFSKQFFKHKWVEQRSDELYETLVSSFPGALEKREIGFEEKSKEAYHHDIPQIRSRTRMWMRKKDFFTSKKWEIVEQMYLHASDEKMNPIFLEGELAYRKFPGVNTNALTNSEIKKDLEYFESVALPRMGDVEENQYRAGLVQFLKERLREEGVFLGVTQLQVKEEGVQFYSAGKSHHLKIKNALCTFFTPHLIPWVKKEFTNPNSEPKGIRVWELWKLVSRDPIDPRVIANFDELMVWAEEESPHELCVLRAGPIFSNWKEWVVQKAEPYVFSEDSLESMHKLCVSLLHWDRFSVRKVEPKYIFEWDNAASTVLQKSYESWLIPACDGSVTQSVFASNRALKKMIKGKDDG